MLVAVVLAGICVAPPLGVSAEEESDSGLVFTIEPETLKLKNDGPITIKWELENKGPSAVYICQWPGAAFGGGWVLDNGIKKGWGPGYPSSRRLERKFFIELKPGEALLGTSTEMLFGNEVGEIWLRGEYRCDQTGGEHGLNAWRGSASSDRVRITVPRVTTED